jgi:flagellar hook assembly protein FlgD
VAKLELYDVRGRLVRRLADGLAPAGDHGARWDLTDDNGARVGTGLYFARVAVDGLEPATTRVTVLR